MSGKGADVHKKDLKGEDVEVEVKEEETDDSGGSLSIPGVSKKHILIGAILIVVAYGALQWLSGDGGSENGGADGSSGTDDGSEGGEDVDISEDIDFSEFDDIDEGAEEGEDADNEEEMSFEEAQDRAASEITEDTPY